MSADAFDATHAFDDKVIVVRSGLRLGLFAIGFAWTLVLTTSNGLLMMVANDPETSPRIQDHVQDQD